MSGCALNPGGMIQASGTRTTPRRGRLRRADELGTHISSEAPDNLITATLS